MLAAYLNDSTCVDFDSGIIFVDPDNVGALGIDALSINDNTAVFVPVVKVKGAIMNNV